MKAKQARRRREALLLERREQEDRAHRRHAERIEQTGPVCSSWQGHALRWVLKATGLLPRGLKNALEPRWIGLTLSLPRLPAAFDGFRILHVSDLHLAQ